MSTTINTTELVQAHVNEFERERTWKNVTLQEALHSSAEYTINVVGLVQRQYPIHKVKVEIDHIAIFRSKDASEIFASLADDFGYWVMSIRDAIESEITVRFTHQVDGVTVKNLAHHALWITRFVHELGGTYGNWLVQETSKGSIKAPKQHDRCVTGINWHQYRKAYENYPSVAWSLHQPIDGFKYVEDPFYEDFYSVLKMDSIRKLMTKLRAGDGKIRYSHLQHFEDRHLAFVKEILQKCYYQQECDPVFASTALALDRMGRRKLAIEVGIHAIEVGERYEDFMLTAKTHDELHSTNYADEFRTELLYRDLQSNLEHGKHSSLGPRVKI